MPLEAIEGFLRSPYNAAADAKMLLFFLHPSATSLAVIVGLVALSLVVKHLWCRYLCPYGALLGVASLLSPLSVRRDPRRLQRLPSLHARVPARDPGARAAAGALVGVHGLHVVRRGLHGPRLPRRHAQGAPARSRRGSSRRWRSASMLGVLGDRPRDGVLGDERCPAEAFRFAYRVMGIG